MGGIVQQRDPAEIPRRQRRESSLNALRWLSAPSTGRPLVALIVSPIRPQSDGAVGQEAGHKSFPRRIAHPPPQQLEEHLLSHRRFGEFGERDRPAGVYDGHCRVHVLKSSIGKVLWCATHS